MHIGRPFYSLDQPSYARFYGHDRIRNMAVESYSIQGIYTAPDSVFIDAPMLRLFDDRIGLQCVPLLTELEPGDGDLVEVQGSIMLKEIPMKGTGHVRRENVLMPEEVRIIRTSSELKKTAQETYLGMRESLQQQITPKESHLVLRESPKWFVVWSKSDDSFIVSTRQIDLMYQAEIDFVFDGPSGKLRDVYAVEWFKGE